MSAYAGLRNIILIGTLFGFHGLLNRSLLIDGVNEIFIVTSRISVVTLLIGIYCFREFISSISVEYFLKGSLSGILAIFIPGWAFIYALKYISSGLSFLKIVSVLTGLIGLIILFFSGATGLSNEGNLLIGGLLAVLGVQGLALSNITNKKHLQYIPSKTYLLTQWLVGSVISIILFFILDGKFEILTAGEFSKLFGLAFIDIFNYSLFLYTIKRLSATFTTLVDYVVPIVGILVGYIFLDEIVDNIFFVTLILIFISLYLAVKDESENLN